jgi:hypothetical protein
MATRVTVYHSEYGCETGCCGHYVKIESDGKEKRAFDFGHPYGDDPRKYAEELVRREYGDEHVKDLDWAHSYVEDT